MRIIHLCPGLGEANGMAVAAGFLAKEQNAVLADAGCVCRGMVRDADEVWVHSCWLPCVWRACWLALRARKRLVRMLHGNVDPVRLGHHGWKKRLVGPIERYFLRRADVVVATCRAEAEWIRQYEPRVKKIEVTDVKRFFDFSRKEHKERKGDGKLHLLYLGRRHPLKGLEFLEAAVKEVEGCELRIVSNAFGEEKERVWEWCDVLVQPTLSENFGLVIAEALERGKRVITTDGAPAWGSECKMESVKCKVEEVPPSWHFTLFTLHFTLFSHTGLSGRRRLPRNSTATGRSVHQKLIFHARDFAASLTTSHGASAAPTSRVTASPTDAAATRPNMRNVWKMPVPRPRISGGSVSVRYIGSMTLM